MTKVNSGGNNYGQRSEAVLFHSYTSLDCLVFYFSPALVVSSPTASFFELLKRMFAD